MKEGDECMSLIRVSDMTFCYEGSFDPVFENVSISLDTNWKLGLIGRNGKGKTTFLRILEGELSCSGSITASVHFDYYPYSITDESVAVADLIDIWKPGTELWRVCVELSDLKLDADILYRPISSLSFGELTKVMLAVLFSGENDFLLIDEPTNHLDRPGRDSIRDYLAKKKGFILVSHDRELLDACADHMLVLNRASIEVQSGNFSSWWENKERADAFAIAENEKHKREIDKLKAAADRAARWADQNERTKIGFDPIKEPERNISTRSYIGAKTKKMQSRVKATQGRIEREIAEKEGLLNDIERVENLKLNPLTHHKEVLIESRQLELSYRGAEAPAVSGLSFMLRRGERVCLSGGNGCGKSSVIRALLKKIGKDTKGSEGLSFRGELYTAPEVKISYVSQDTSEVHGTLTEFAERNSVDYTLLLTLLSKLDLSSVQFSKDIGDYSEGQKKKVLIAASLITPAHIYIWDEPLNYIDVFSRMQIEELIKKYTPTMLFVEHDQRFCDIIATKKIEL